MIRIAATLWSMSLQAGVLILVILAVRFCFRRYPKIYSYCLWGLVALRLLCPVFVETPFSLLPGSITADSIAQGGGTKETLRAEQDAGVSNIPEAAPGAVALSEAAGADEAGDEELPEIVGADAVGNGELPETAGGDTLGNEELPEAAGADEAGDEELPETAGADEAGTAGLFEAAGIDATGGGRPAEAAKPSSNRDAVSGMKEDGIPGNAAEGKESGRGIAGQLPGALAAAYIAGVGFVFCVCAAQYWGLKRKTAAAVREEGRIWRSENIDTPFVAGIFRPKIMLPYHIGGDEARYILRHEAMHIRHRDPLICLLGLLCVCLHWWNPLVWLAYCKMNQDMEMCCDEAVLRKEPKEERVAYAKALFAFAGKRSGLFALPAFGESHTEKRIENLAKQKKGGCLPAGLTVLLAVFCGAAFLTVPVCGTQQSQGREEDTRRESGEDREDEIVLGSDAGGEGGIVPGSDAGGEEKIISGNNTEGEGEIVPESDAGGEDEIVPGSGAGGEKDTGREGEGEEDIRREEEERPSAEQTDVSVPDGQIEEQSFVAEINPYGTVVFASFEPDQDKGPYADVCFRLLRDGETVYEFPSNEFRTLPEEMTFRKIEAVAFPDLNQDGYTDVVTIASYWFLETIFHETRIFTGTKSGDFVEERYLEEAYNQSHELHSIADILDFAARPQNQDYFLYTSIYGKWRVTEHIAPTGIYALSAEEIEGFEGIELEYGRYWFKRSTQETGQILDRYKREQITAAELEEAFSVNAADLGIDTDTLACYELQGVRFTYREQNAQRTTADNFGVHFYLIDGYHALIYHEGVFFRAERE